VLWYLLFCPLALYPKSLCLWKKATLSRAPRSWIDKKDLPPLIAEICGIEQKINFALCDGTLYIFAFDVTDVLR
jgi:hypothetical protein